MHKSTLLCFCLLCFNTVSLAQENHKELARLVEQDQQERQEQKYTFYKDLERRERVKAILEANEVRTTVDYYNAALIFHHGNSPEDYLLARELALKSLELDPSNRKSKWLSCAAEDRYLLHIGKPQVWGTHIVSVGEGGELGYRLPFDRNAKTDEERREMGILSLDEITKRLALEKSKN